MAGSKYQRRTERVPMQTFASIETVGVLASNNQTFGVVLDVSRNGLGLRTGQPPGVGLRVIVRVGIGEEIRPLKAIVRRLKLRSQNVFDVGLEWQDCSTNDLSFVDEFEALHASR